MKSDTRAYYENVVRASAETITQGLDGALDLTALARRAALAPLHFHRIFRGLVGETPLALHRRLRMERAAHQLAREEGPIVRVAFDAGYETHESFTRAFGDHYGMSPSLFRQRAVEAAAACARPPQIELASRCGLHFQPDNRPITLSLVTPGALPMHVDFQHRPAVRVAAVHHVGPYPRISEAFARLGQLAGPAGLIRPPVTEMLALYHDDPEAVPAEELRSDAAVSVGEDARLPEGLTELRIPGGEYARTQHIGPYSGLGDAWAQLMGVWLPASGRRLGDGPSFEIYRNNPETTPAEKLCTELYIPLAPA